MKLLDQYMAKGVAHYWMREAAKAEAKISALLHDDPQAIPLHEERAHCLTLALRACLSTLP